MTSQVRLETAEYLGLSRVEICFDDRRWALIEEPEIIRKYAHADHHCLYARRASSPTLGQEMIRCRRASRRAAMASRGRIHSRILVSVTTRRLSISRPLKTLAASISPRISTPGMTPRSPPTAARAYIRHAASRAENSARGGRHASSSGREIFNMKRKTQKVISEVHEHRSIPFDASWR